MGEEGVLDHDLGQGVGDVGELVREADVAGGEDPRVGGLEPVVDFDAGLDAVVDAHDFEPQTLDIRRPAHAHEDLVDDPLRGCSTCLEMEDFPSARRSTRASLESKRNSTPSPCILSWTTRAASASSRGRIRPDRSMTVTRLPNRANA